MTAVRMMSHVPLLQIDAPRVEIGGGALVAVDFEDYDDLLLGSFTDGRHDYEATRPVFFVSEREVDVEEETLADITAGVAKGDPRAVSAANGLDMRLSAVFTHWDRHLADCARVRDALALAEPGTAIPDPALSLRLIDLAGKHALTQTMQGQADQELLFLGSFACSRVTADALARAAELLEVVDRCEGELRQALDALHGAADLSLHPVEQLTLCTIAVEALLLPDLSSGLKQTFATRLAHLVGGEDTDAVARALYASRSDAVHGEAGAQATPGIAQSLLARAIQALADLTRDGSALADIRARLDAGPATATARPPAWQPPPPSPRILHQLRRGTPPLSSSHSLTAGGPPTSDPDVAEGQLVLFAPLVGLEIDALPDALIEVGFPLTWMWPSQIAGLEDPDIRRDWMASVRPDERPIACLALAAAPTDRLRDNRRFDQELRPLRGRVDTAVTALRLAGLASFHDPDLLGVYAREGGGARFRRPAVYRQTVVTDLGRFTQPLEAEAAADLAALWPLLLGYEAGRPRAEIDHALTLFRRAHIWLGLSVATRLELLFASLEAAVGRPPSDGVHPLARPATVTDRHAAAFDWYATSGRQVRNAIAHGDWAPDEDERGPEALRHLRTLLGEVLPALLMAWRARKKAGPAKTLATALRDAPAALDWRTAAAEGDPAQAELRTARAQRYAGLDVSVTIDRGRRAAATGDVDGARAWFTRAQARGDVRGDYGLALLALDAGDDEAARTLLTTAVEHGFETALGPLGKLERNRGNIEAGRAHLRRAVDLGDADAVISLGILERAAGNIDAARDLYERASDAGDLRATYNLGLLEDHVGDRQAALRWFTLCAEAGVIDAMGWAGDVAAQIGDRDTARSWWRQAAENGDANSAGRLGEEALSDGDLAQARVWFQQAATAGNAQAALRLDQLDGASVAEDG